MSNIARLGAILSLDTKEFVKGVDVAQLKSKEFKQNLKDTQQVLNGVKSAANATALAMLAFGAMAAKTADDISDLADANDTTIGKVLELKHALVASGGDASKLTQFFSSFTNAVDGAAQGSDKLRDAFKEVGVSTKDLAKLTQDELLDKSLAGLAKLDDTVRRNAIAMQLFGKAAKGVDFRNLSDEQKKLVGHFDAQAKAIKESAMAVQKLELFFVDLQLAAVMAIRPITELVNKLPDETRIETIAKAFTYLGEAIAIAMGVAAVKGVAKLATALRILYLTNPLLLAFGVAGAAAGYGIAKYLESQVPETEETTKPKGDGRSMEKSARDKINDKYDAEIALVKELEKAKMVAYANDSIRQINSLDLESKKYQLSTNEYERQKLLLQLYTDKGKAREEADKAILEAQKAFELAPAEEHKRAEELFNAKKKSIEEIYRYESGYLEIVNEKRQANLEAEIERQQSWAAGWDEAFKQYMEASERASDRGREAFQTVVSSMETALKNFVETGKLNFKDLIATIIKQLLIAETVAQASGLFKMAFKAVGNMFGPSTIGSGLASGGEINSPRLVGENGAELFVPSTPGTIIPHGSWQQMAAAGSGGSGITVNGNYIANMSAIDTQSATQFLAKNKTAIWASYQSANRSVPISR